MPAFSINLIQSLSALYPIQGAYVVPEQIQPNTAVNYSGVRVITNEELAGVSALGNPILCPVKFEKTSWMERDSNGILQRHTIPELILPPTCLVSVKRGKKIVETELIGGNGSVTEHLGLQDSEIDIVGVLLNMDTYTYPSEQKEALNKLYEVPKEIGIVCPYLYDLGIYSVVIKELDFPSSEQYQNIQPFRMTLKEDRIYTINEKPV